MARLWLVPLAVLVLSSCKGDEGGADGPPGDAGGPADIAWTGDLPGPDRIDAVDAPASDAGKDAALPPPKPALPAVPAFPELPPLCDEPEPEKLQWPMDAKKVSLSVYHFNIQYVAGGLDDYLGFTASEEEIEDLIIVESFEPIVALFEKHPTWGGSFEMQGLMLEVMAARHPGILKRFHALVRRGQVDVMSFHWSDQLVLAYGRQHMEWSWQENRVLFDGLCLPRARVHFLQEGQYGPGLGAFAAEKEGAALVLPRNLYGLFHDPKASGLIHENVGHRVLVTSGHAGEGLELSWNFVDDGELLATGKMNPYLLETFVHRPEAVKSYEEKLQKLEDDGYLITTITHYLHLVDDRQIPPTVIDPPVLDGTWQPDDSSNMLTWMGGSGQLPGEERDNRILTGNVEVGQRLSNVEWLLGRLDELGTDTGAARAALRHAIRELLKAEVSDATGWRPVATEIEYGLTHQAAARAVVDQIAAWALYELGHTGTVEVDAAAGEVRVPSPSPEGTPGEPRALPGPPPALSSISVDTERPYTATWTAHDAYVQLSLELPATGKTTSATETPPVIRVVLPLLHDAIVMSPALAVGKVLEAPLSAYSFVEAGQRAAFSLPNGLLALGPGLTMVLDQRSVHVAATIEPGKVVLEDAVQPAHEPATWRIRFYELPAEAAVEHAERLNHRPPSVFAVTAQ